MLYQHSTVLEKNYFTLEVKVYKLKFSKLIIGQN
jgi:hypothetical protein